MSNSVSCCVLGEEAAYSEGIYDKKKKKDTVGFRILVSSFRGENGGCQVSAQPLHSEANRDDIHQLWEQKHVLVQVQNRVKTSIKS